MGVQLAGDTDTAMTRLHCCRLWTLRQNNRRISAEVVWAEGEWHLRVFAQGILFMWHPCPRLEAALQYAEMIRDDCAHDRWR